MKTIIIDGVEYNLTPKVQFKNGDWVVCKNGSHKVFQVIERSWPDAKYLDEKGDERFLNVFTLDEQYRPWTIQDAKEGDLLADNYGIYIFDRFDKYDKRCYLCRGAYQYSQKEYENEHMLCSVEAHPATKEQRDLLFQKMKEAGYEWDTEKKELKKIEQNPTDEVGNYGHKEVLQTIINGQNPCWSEEDINMFGSILSTLGICANNPQIPADVRSIHKKEESWFNELYHRVQPMQEWSEEDERIYKSITYSFAHNYPLTVQQQEFVKSLRPQNTWKPSGEQIACLHDAVARYNQEGFSAATLTSLLEQLKKLREE